MEKVLSAAEALIAEANALIEAMREKKVRALNILDTEPEEVFDEITNLATNITKVPCAIVFIEGERSFLKSVSGGPYSGNEDRQHSFCNIAIQTPKQCMIVPDALLDSRVCDNPHVASGNVRFYLGSPLLDDEGTALGAVCIFDSKPRAVDPETIALMQGLSRICSLILKRRR